MLKSKLMSFGKRVGRVFGLEIKRTRSADFNYKWLECQNFRTILDIGAYIGEFSKSIHKILPEARIYAFEPLNDSYNRLIARTKHLPRFKAFNFALGEKDDDKVEIHRCKFLPSSSLLSMCDLHKEMFPATDGEVIKEIRLRRLDSIVRELDIEENILIKMDVQGYEDRVIAGGKETFSKAKTVIAETSFEQLYEGQAFFDDIYNIMKGMGFSFKGSWGPMMKSPIDGHVVYCDSVFVRESM